MDIGQFLGALVSDIAKSKPLSTQYEGPKITDRIQAAITEDGETPVCLDLEVTWRDDTVHVQYHLTPAVYDDALALKVQAVVTQAVTKSEELKKHFRKVFNVPADGFNEPSENNPNASGAV